MSAPARKEGQHVREFQGRSDGGGRGGGYRLWDENRSTRESAIVIGGRSASMEMKD